MFYCDLNIWTVEGWREGCRAAAASRRGALAWAKSERGAAAGVVMGGMSVEVAEQPEVKGKVRAVHGPGCQSVRAVPGEPGKSKFLWLMDCDYKGMVPNSIIEIAMPSAQLQMIDCIKKIA